MKLQTDDRTRAIFEVILACLPAPMPVYLVGGAVRDMLLGLPVRDLDFVVPSDSLRLARAVRRNLGAAGFTLDDERLKKVDQHADYFDELLSRIREIRASETRVYQRIREIFALASDYVEDQQETMLFFATMQNKMHFAASGLTAAEVIHQRANAELPNMGLTSWKNSLMAKF